MGGAEIYDPPKIDGVPYPKLAAVPPSSPQPRAAGQFIHGAAQRPEELPAQPAGSAAYGRGGGENLRRIRPRERGLPAIDVYGLFDFSDGTKVARRFQRRVAPSAEDLVGFNFPKRFLEGFLVRPRRDIRKITGGVVVLLNRFRAQSFD